MSAYPRAEAPSIPLRPFVYDQAFAVVRVLTTLYAVVSHFLAFHARWERIAPDLSIFVYAPPLGNHLSTQIVGAAIGLYASVALWNGRGWAFAYALLASLGACVLAFVIPPTALVMALFVAVHVPSFVYSGLRLIGTIGPPTGGPDLRRRMGGG